MLRKRASAILTRGGELLLIRRENKQGLYYVFPGGGIQQGESAEQAVVREMKEEAALLVTPREVLVRLVGDYDDNTLVICTQNDDTDPVWQEQFKQTDRESYLFVWMPISELSSLKLLPIEGRDAVIDYLTQKQ